MRVAANIEHFLFEFEERDLPEFIVLEFYGREGLSQLTHFEIELLCPEQDIDFSKILNKRAALRIWCWQDNDYGRVYHGIISSFEQVRQIEEYAVFRAHLVPILWRLTLNSQSRIFQEKSAPEIIEDVLTGGGFQSDDYKLSLNGEYEPINKPPREFCIQYRESDFDFISRLMEEEGIFYFFEYTEGKEVLVLADDDSVYKDTEPMGEIEYRVQTGLQPLEEEFISSLQYRENVLTDRVMTKDFNYDTPQTILFANSQVSQEDSSFVYNYPGRFGFLDRGTDLAAIRKQEIDAGRKVISGSGNCRSLCAGYCFTLSRHFRSDLNIKHLLTSVSHHGVQGGPMATDAQTRYENQFECMPAEIPYRPARVTAKPVIQGAQTAIVVGPQNEEIYVDEKGRVKIQFHWDLEGKYNEESSCWIRVSQSWAGAGWGGIFIPRVGQEVIVEFLEGDPDQPIITGTLYNGDHQVPYRLPDEKTKASIKSLSSPGGGGFNEIRFEDKKDEEQIFIRAQKNQDSRVNRDSLEWVGEDQHLIIKRDQLELVEGDKHLGVKGNHNEKVDGTMSVEAGMNMQEKVSMKYALDAGNEIHLKSGINLVIESGTTLTLKVGENFININSGGVFIKGSMVMINSGGSAGSGAGASPDPPTAPQEADTGEPGEVGKALAQEPPQMPTMHSLPALALKEAAQNARPFCPT